MKVGCHVFSCRSLLLSTTVLNDNYSQNSSYFSLCIKLVTYFSTALLNNENNRSLCQLIPAYL